MIDNLLTAPSFIPLQPPHLVDLSTLRSMEETIRPNLMTAQVFDITSVSDYLYNGTDQEEWDVYHDFPCLMPPFRSVWMEHSKPKSIKSEKHGEVKWVPCEKVGVLVSTIEAPDERPPGIPENCHYIQNYVLFLQGPVTKRKDEIVGPVVWSYLCTDEHGIPLGEGKFGFPTMGLKLQGGLQSDLHTSILAEMRSLFFPSMLAITFMNCRNTVLVEHSPEQKLSKVHQKKHGRPLVRFRTICVEPIRKIFRDAAGSDSSIKRALHICRGHFKDYRESGLFGRNKGLYWWGSQVRGTVKSGVVLKDYTVAAPDKEE